MGFPVDSLAIRTRRRKAEPIFLDRRSLGSLERSIEIVENWLGIERGIAEPAILDDLREIWKNSRLARAIMRLLIPKYYDFVNPRLEDILKRDELSRFRKIGVSNPSDLRRLVFSFLNERGRGFLESSISRDLEEFLGVDLERLREIMWIDDPDRAVLIRISKPRAEDLIPEYNYHYLDTILKVSELVRLRLPLDLRGSLARWLFRRCKIAGLICEFKSEGSRILCEISGPQSVTDSPNRYGRRMSDTVMRLISKLESSQLAWSMDARMLIEKRRVDLTISSRSVSEIRFPDRYESDEEVERFDSSLEEEFARRLEKLGWRVEREPLAIVLENGRIFVPDFVVERRGRRYLVEIVGFWTKDYIKRKARKLRELQGRRDLLVIYRKDLENELGDLDLPRIPFSKELPISRISSLLQELSGSPTIEDLEDLLSSKLGSIKRELEERSWIHLSRILEILELPDWSKLPDEIRDRIKKLEEDLGSEFVEGLGFVSKRKLAILEERLEELPDRVPIEELERISREIFGEGFPIASLIQGRGWSLRWHGISKIYALRRRGL